MHIADKTKFETWIKSLLQRNSGASKYEERTQDGVTYFVASRPFGTESAPSLYWQYIGSDVLLAGPDAMESFVAATKRNNVRTSGAAVSQTPLSADPTYVALNQKIPQGDIKVFARGKDLPDAKADTQAGDPVAAGAKKDGSIAASVVIAASGVNLDAFVDFPVAGLAEALDGEGPLSLASRVEDDAVIVMLTRTAKPEGLKALRDSPLTADAVDRMLTGFTRATQLDAEKELVPLLKGPVTLGVHVMDLTTLPSAIARRVSTSALLEFVHVSLTAEIANRDQMVALLDKSQGLVEQAGSKVTKRTATVGGKQATIYEPEGAGIGWGVVDNLYVYGAGKGRIDRAIEQAVAAKEDKSVAPKLTGTVAADLGKQRGSVLVVARAAALADNVAKLSASDDTMIKAVMPMVSQAIEVLRTVGDVAIATKVEKEGVRIEARETLR